MKDLYLSELVSEMYKKGEYEKEKDKIAIRCRECGSIYNTFTSICERCGNNLLTDGRKINCPFCNHENVEEQRVCGWCNKDMEKIAKCEICGLGIPLNEPICPHCGFDRYNILQLTSEESRAIKCKSCSLLINIEEEYCPYCAIRIRMKK